jgi:hypothetical protein
MVRLLVAVTGFGTIAGAQWLNYPVPGIPRLPDGRPNLKAPTPRTPEGKPDLDGIWFIDETPPPGEFGERPVALRGEIKTEDIILTPEGEALARQPKQLVGAQCLPFALPGLAAAQPFKIISKKGVLVILYEVETIYRQVFIDGRRLPKDPNPAWMGYSVGKWEGDTLVVDTTGFNDKVPVFGGRPHSEGLQIVERFRRPDFGHLQIEYTMNDPRVYAKPWTIRQSHHLTPDTELLEHVCNENEKDLKHMVGEDK